MQINMLSLNGNLWKHHNIHKMSPNIGKSIRLYGMFGGNYEIKYKWSSYSC